MSEDLVKRWRAWKSGQGEPPLPQIDGSRPPVYAISEHDLTWAMLEIERLRKAIEGLVKMDGGRH